MLKLQDYPPSANFVAISLKFSQNPFPVYFRVTIFIDYCEGHMSHGAFIFKIYLI